MRLSGSITASRGFVKNLERMNDDAVGRMQVALTESALVVHGEARKSIQRSPKDGRTGRSSPGNPPATQTGVLVNSIFFRVEDEFAEVGTNLKYGSYLEFGTRWMDPRPWLEPAFRLGAQKFAAIFKKAFKGFGDE